MNYLRTGNTAMLRSSCMIPKLGIFSLPAPLMVGVLHGSSWKLEIISPSDLVAIHDAIAPVSSKACLGHPPKEIWTKHSDNEPKQPMRTGPAACYMYKLQRQQRLHHQTERQICPSDSVPSSRSPYKIDHKRKKHYSCGLTTSPTVCDK